MRVRRLFMHPFIDSFIQQTFKTLTLCVSLPGHTAGNEDNQGCLSLGDDTFLDRDQTVARCSAT